MIKIIDYGLGNVQAFLNVYRRIGIKAERTKTGADLADATHVILPGVGSFDHAMTLFNASSFRKPLEDRIAKGDLRLLGVCVGMQMLADSSEEGDLPGLGWVSGTVRRFSSDGRNAPLYLPHMGWNDVTCSGNDPLFEGLQDSARFYFLHSYYFDAVAPTVVPAKTAYGPVFDSAVRNNHVYGVQFHPEKSHHWGQILLNNFAKV